MKWYQNLNAMPKIMAAFGITLFFFLSIGFLAIRQISQLNDLSLQIFYRDVGGMDAIKQAEVDGALISRTLATAALSAGNSSVIEQTENEFKASLADLRTSLNNGYARSIRASLRQQLQSANSQIPSVEQAAQQLFAEAKAGNRAAVGDSLKIASPYSDKLRATLHQASVMKEANVEIFRAEHNKIMQKARAQFVALLLVAAGFSLLVSFSIARSFSIPLRQAAEVLGHVANGDLTRHLEIDTKNEIGRLAKALNAALGNMREVLSKVIEASSSLTSASAKLAQSVDVMASGAHEQAASLEQTSASLEQITASVRQNSDNARQASQFAISSRDAAEKGGTVVHSAIDAMNEIDDASGKIAAIIRVIDEIAFQTNLLAVNASVEAARAREHGKGFAVVATEVRTLAQRSGSAAKEIKALIGDSRRKVENGSALVNKSGKTLTDIVASVKRVTDIVSEIAAASREQSTGIEQVNSAMLQMDRVMQSNSSQTEQLAATANVLASQAVHLEQLIGRFVVKTGAPKPKEERKRSKSAADSVAPKISQPSVDPASATSAALGGLAVNVGHSVSSAALDEEFEEF